MTIVLAIVAGLALGAVFARGDFCFHSTWRRALAEQPNTSLLRAYVVLLVVSIPIVQLLVAVDFIDPFVPHFAPAAAMVGGAVFGIGMVVAQTCISGMFYKLGAGMIAMVTAISAWAIGDIVTWRGPLKGLRDSLNENQISSTAADGSDQSLTVTSWLGPSGAVLVVVVVVALAVWAARDEAAARSNGTDTASVPLSGIRLGVLTALVMSGAWVLVRWHGVNFTYGTASVPSQIWNRAVNGEDIEWWIPLALVSLIPGAFLAATTGKTLWIRGEEPRRYVELIGGGLIMAVGAGIAGGCNLGHAMVGVPLLSVGSIATTAAIVVGVFVADRTIKALGAR